MITTTAYITNFIYRPGTVTPIFMSDDELETQVDALLDLLKHNETIAVAEAAEQLGVDKDVVQQWVDFLVEERIVGIEYKFTKPYVYLNEPDEVEEDESEAESFEELREEYLRQAEEKEIPESNRRTLWRQHVEKILEQKKPYFEDEADKRGLEPSEQLWNKYKERLLNHGS